MFRVQTPVFVIILVLITTQQQQFKVFASDVKNLIGEPDFKKVTLRWETRRVPNNFQIRYCELQSWGSHRCRIKPVDENDSNEIPYENDLKIYTTNVDGLKMATTYSFEVKSSFKERANKGYRNENVIVLPTKGFSARATQCLPHASDIEVSTGPYFGGRIAVEAKDGEGERCAVDGNAKSPKETYTLRIDHAKCGSRVNSTTVATFVIVQENLPILTHSTRRFLVLCSYQPETLTVRAGISLPTNRNNGRVKTRQGKYFRDEREIPQQVDRDDIIASPLVAASED